MPVEFSPENERQLERLLSHYPNKRAACIPALHMAQAQFGYLSGDAIELVARKLGLTPADVYGTASFYTMFRFKPEGKHHLEVCTNIACMLMGSAKIVEHLEGRLGCKLGETTADGLVTLREVECLGACDHAPMMQLDEEFVFNLDPAKLDKIIADLRAGQADRPGGSGGTARGSK